MSATPQVNWDAVADAAAALTAMYEIYDRGNIDTRSIMKRLVEVAATKVGITAEQTREVSLSVFDFRDLVFWPVTVIEEIRKHLKRVRELPGLDVEAAERIDHLLVTVDACLSKIARIAPGLVHVDGKPLQGRAKDDGVDRVHQDTPAPADTGEGDSNAAASAGMVSVPAWMAPRPKESGNLLQQRLDLAKLISNFARRVAEGSHSPLDLLEARVEALLLGHEDPLSSVAPTSLIDSAARSTAATVDAPEGTRVAGPEGPATPRPTNTRSNGSQA